MYSIYSYKRCQGCQEGCTLSVTSCSLLCVFVVVVFSNCKWMSQILQDKRAHCSALDATWEYCVLFLRQIMKIAAMSTLFMITMVGNPSNNQVPWSVSLERRWKHGGIIYSVHRILWPSWLITCSRALSSLPALARYNSLITTPLL